MDVERYWRAALEEYWGDDGPPPRWRQEMGIGRPIR